MSLPEKAVPLSVAVTAITNYRASIQGTAGTPIHAFLLKHSDIMGVLQILPKGIKMKYDRFRGYLGTTGTGAGLSWHLYVCPVDDSEDQNDIILETDDGIAYVYDFNTPCPTVCDRNYSPLNNIQL